MPEQKLHEKRLKERARRNGMAQSIDGMRLIVPELADSKKTYSQAKVVAIALEHIYELQRENAEYRERLGLKPREVELKMTKRAKNARLLKTTAKERPAKRARVMEPEEEAPAPAPTPASLPERLPLMAPVSLPPSTFHLSEVSDGELDEVVFSSDSLSVSDTPLTLSPRHEGMFAFPYEPLHEGWEHEMEVLRPTTEVDLLMASMINTAN